MGGQHGFSNIHREYQIHTIQPEELATSKELATILGLIFNLRMTWNEHILYAKAKAEKNESY
jgi:hypothetical protein